MECSIDELLLISKLVDSVKKLKEFGYDLDKISKWTIKAYNSNNHLESKIKDPFNNDLIIKSPVLIEKVDSIPNKSLAFPPDDFDEKDDYDIVYKRLTKQSCKEDLSLLQLIHEHNCKTMEEGYDLHDKMTDNYQINKRKEEENRPAWGSKKKYHKKTTIRYYSEEDEYSNDEPSYENNFVYQEIKNDVTEIKSEVKPEVKSDDKPVNKTVPLHCHRCKNDGHIEKFCRINMNVICESCEKYGHHVSRCQISCSICNARGHKTIQHGKYCDFCKRYNHTNEECWKKNK